MVHVVVFLFFFGGYLPIIFYGGFIPRDSKFEGTYLVLKVLFEKNVDPNLAKNINLFLNPTQNSIIHVISSHIHIY